jgi:hypothetical protein
VPLKELAKCGGAGFGGAQDQKVGKGSQGIRHRVSYSSSLGDPLPNSGAQTLSMRIQRTLNRHQRGFEPRRN